MKIYDHEAVRPPAPSPLFVPKYHSLSGQPREREYIILFPVGACSPQLRTNHMSLSLVLFVIAI